MDGSNPHVRQIKDVTVVTAGPVVRIGDLPDGGLIGLLDGTGRKVVLDLSSSEFLMPDFMGQVIRAHRITRDGPDQLRLCCRPGGIRDVLRIIRVDRLVPVDPTLDAAVNGFRSNSHVNPPR